jgi:putative ABC transport system substrate-binding protein
MAGQTSECDDDRLKLLAEVLHAQADPGRNRKVHILYKKDRPKLEEHKLHLNGEAKGLGIDTSDDEVGDDAAIDDAFGRLAGVDGLLVTADAFFNNRRERMVRHAAERRLPAIYQWREFVEIGGLMSYGPSIIEAYVFAGAYAARILKDEKPAEMEVSKPTHYELVINRTTVGKLGITIPESLKNRAEWID